jgi:purine-nucleoside phosphorylase
MADEVDVTREVNFTEAGLAVSTVTGHTRKLLFGKLGGSDFVLMKGRIHFYEGHGAEAVTVGVRWMAEQGADSLVLTNAADKVNRDFAPGEWMMLSDHLNLIGASPLSGASFIEISVAYDAARRVDFRIVAAARGMKLNEGVLETGMAAASAMAGLLQEVISGNSGSV